MALPRKTVEFSLTLCALADQSACQVIHYFVIIAKPIAMWHLQNFAPTKHYKSVTQYAADWHLVWNNARQYNETDSQIYEDADTLQEVFDARLRELILIHCVPGIEEDGEPGM